MDNAQKAIMIGVGLFLTILIVSVVLLVTNLGISTTKDAKDQSGKINENLQKQLVSQYDGRVITGQDIIYALNQYAQTFENKNIYLSKSTTITGNPNANNINLNGDTPLHKNGNDVRLVSFTGSTSIHMTMPGNSINEFKSHIKLNSTYNSYIVKDSDQKVIGLYFAIK